MTSPVALSAFLPPFTPPSGVFMLTITVDLLPLVTGLIGFIVDALGDIDFGSLS